MNSNKINKLSELLLECASEALDHNKNAIKLTLNRDNINVIFDITFEVKVN